MLELSVFQLNNYIKNLIDEDQLLFFVGVFGEVSNFKISGNNAYFDIIDEDAQISCIKFGATENEIQNGSKVLASGRVNYHSKYGKLTFIVSKVEPYGMGSLYTKFLQLKAKLEGLGVFDERNKKQLPKFAKTIGVVTSATGAVIHDIINVTRKNNPRTNIVLFPAKVQGEGAEDEIASGIKQLDKMPEIDVIIVASGGGSFEDLSPFNTEKVAMAVYECKTPIISAVGHETDFSLSDFAADLRAPTPSVAAQIAVFNYYDEIARIEDLMSGIKYRVRAKLSLSKNDVRNVVNEILIKLTTKINGISKMVVAKSKQIENQVANIVLNKKRELELLSAKIEKQNPMFILKKGYTKAYNNGILVKSVDDVKQGDKLSLNVVDGVITTQVIKGEKRWIMNRQ